MLVGLPDADTLAAVFERAATLLQAEGLLPTIPEAEPSTDVKQIAEVEQNAGKAPIATVTSSRTAHRNARRRTVLLIAGASAVTLCWLVAIKNRLKGYRKPRVLPAALKRRCLALAPHTHLTVEPHRLGRVLRVITAARASRQAGRQSGRLLWLRTANSGCL